MLRTPPYPESLETRKEIEKHINKLLDMDVIRKIGNNEIVEITTPGMMESLGFKKCNFGQQEQLALGHKVSGLSLEIDQTKVVAVLQSSLCKLCSKDVVFEITKERRDAYERIKNELTNAPVLILPDFELPFKLYIDAACSQGLGVALHHRHIVDGEPREGVICYISRQLKYTESRYGATKTERLCLVWDLEKLHYYLEGAVFEVYTYCTALTSLLNMKATNRGNMTIIYKEGESHTNADGHLIMSKATQLMNLK
ncbi:hypothetical protein O181_011206 [Austropuccinia psidii MF-1]|uniref:Reverse transcriptase/retrotransposon-derived protein RNase H-like domain-containing protein n=1 Tax=Austropuccinia psidii MF-1 TaxID=1389203 RepID=A0A9Q3GL44_9BASI|nr:hypothetical protein [Austropuccinia psidii MF-1]